LPKFRVGQKVEFSLDGGAPTRASGRVVWVSQFVNHDTRTGTVRAKLDSKAPAMRAHRFGKLLLSETNETNAVAVPMDAVQWEGCCNVVFVQEAIDRYRPRKVALERGGRGYYNITSGVQTGELVVVRGSYLLKTELKKNSLGAGCCGIDAKS
jgi:cobalt-zinc-cadmium efflux system membrane fusion protein